MTAFKVVTAREQVVLETDDWVVACEAALVKNWPRERGYQRPLYVRGTHPTHDWYRPGGAAACRRCRNCGGWDNGSYGSHAPCGYGWRRDSLLTVLERELVKRDRESSSA